MMNGKKMVQQIIGGVLYNIRAVDLTVLPAISSIASEQASGTEKSEKKCAQLLDYLATHDNARMHYHASDMVLNIHSGASCLSETIARSCVAGNFFLGSKSDPTKPILLNGAIYIMCGILKFVVALASEAELGALFLNSKEGRNIRITLQEMGHPQPSTPIHCENMTATGIANDTIKKQRSQSMKMRLFWVTYQGIVDIQWHTGQENIADYTSKHHDTKHHQVVRPCYIQDDNSLRILPRAANPSALRGCVGTVSNGYSRTCPLPRIGVSLQHVDKVPRGRALV